MASEQFVANPARIAWEAPRLMTYIGGVSNVQNGLGPGSDTILSSVISPPTSSTS